MGEASKAGTHGVDVGRNRRAKGGTGWQVLPAGTPQVLVSIRASFYLEPGSLITISPFLLVSASGKI